MRRAEDGSIRSTDREQARLTGYRAISPDN
jgi:hypothetical protein